MLYRSMPQLIGWAGAWHPEKRSSWKEAGRTGNSVPGWHSGARSGKQSGGGDLLAALEVKHQRNAGRVRAQGVANGTSVD